MKISTVEFFIILLSFGLFSFFLGFYLQNNKIKKFENILLDHSILITILIFLIGFYPSINSSLQQALFTFSSVYFGFWLGNKQKRRDEVTTLKYYLGLIWEEQRFNLHQYEVIIKNFTFLFDNPDKIPLNSLKMGTIYSFSGLLKVEAHNAYISSGAVTTLSSVPLPIKEKDELFNSIEIAYENTKHLKSFLFTVSTDFKNKASMAHLIINSPFAQQAADDMEEKVKDASRELMIARRSAIKARDNVDKFLNKLDVKQNTEELREDTLTDEDKEIMSRVIRRDPISPAEIFRKPTEKYTDV